MNLRVNQMGTFMPSHFDSFYCWFCCCCCRWVLLDWDKLQLQPHSCDTFPSLWHSGYMFRKLIEWVLLSRSVSIGVDIYSWLFIIFDICTRVWNAAARITCKFAMDLSANRKIRDTQNNVQLHCMRRFEKDKNETLNFQRHKKKNEFVRREMKRSGIKTMESFKKNGWKTLHCNAINLAFKSNTS